MALSKGFVTTAGTTAFDARQMDAARLTRNADGTPRVGVLYCPRADGQVGVATGSMTIQIPDQEVFAVQRASGDGLVIMVNNGAYDVPIDQAPTANSRIDIVYVKHNDSAKGDASDAPTFGVAKGTPNPQPSDPAVPAGALPLLRVTIPSGATSTNASGVVVGSVNPFTAVQGGMIRYRSLSTMQNEAGLLPNGTLAVYDVATAMNQVYVMRSGQWSRIDADTFVVVEQQKGNTFQVASGTTAGTLGGTSPAYSSSDTNVFPIRQDGVIGPIAVTGWYDVSGQVNWTSNSTGARFISLTRNDDDLTPRAADLRPAQGSSDQCVNTVMFCNAGDYIKLKGWQNSGSSLYYVSRLTARLMRPNA